MKFSLKEFFLHEGMFDDPTRERDRKPPNFSKLNNTSPAKDFGHGDPSQKPQPEKKPRPDLHPVREFEDPTSSKHPEGGDSMWSSPLSHKSGMPTEIPQDDAQERSADGWEGQRSDSGEDLKKFFGDEPFPKTEARLPGPPRKSGDIELGNTKVNPKELPDEMPDDWFNDLSGVDPQSATAPAEPAPGIGPSAQPEPELDWSAMSDEDFLNSLSSDNTPSLQPIGTAPPKMKDVVKTSEPETPPEKDNFDLPTSVANRDVAEMTWDEFRTNEPDAAAALEREVPPEQLENGRFRKRANRVFFTSGAKRMDWFTDDEDRGWMDLDDGHTPTGKF
jgi:hypothetical protein